MLNQWLSVLGQTLPGPVFGYALEMTQQIRPSSGKRWMRMGFWIAVFFLLAMINVFTNGSFVGAAARWAVFLVTVIVSYQFFYAGSVWKRTAILIMLVVAVAAAEGVFALICRFFHIDALSLDFRQQDMMLGSLMGGIFSIVFLFFVVTLWRRLGKKKRMPRASFVYVLMPLCLVVPFFYYYIQLVQGGGKIVSLHIISMVATAVLDLLLVCIQFNQAEKEGIEKELRELKFQTQLERQHYQNIEARREEIAKIRHDYNNLLTSVLDLLHMDKVQEAEQVIISLLSRVEQTREYQYCGIPIVNAILSEKQKTCDGHHITLRTDLLFPEDVAVEQIDLCSALGNLLDNAIRACAALSPDQTRVITLTMAIQGDYLLIRCDNPAARAPGERPEGSGYGNKILNDIARRYSGSFHTEFSDGIFIARLVLLTQPGTNKT